jgi:F-type H+-transporting ATPase subunit b
VEQGAQIISEMQLQGAAAAQRLVDAARADIQDERERALASLRGDVGDFAVELASRVVGEPLDKEARQRRIVERFLADLEEGQIGEGSEIAAQ